MKFESIKSEYADYLDSKDPLRKYRDAFFIADEDLVYLDGNSLGRLPKASRERLNGVVDTEWGENLISSWNEGWFKRAEDIGDKIAHLVGASKGEVVVADSTSINLFKLLCATLEYNKDRNKIISDVFNFPSDLYIIQGVIKLFGGRHELILSGSRDGIEIDTEALKRRIDTGTAVLILSHVAFKSAFRYDIKEITDAARKAGALVIWDLSHSVGAVPIKLNEWGAELGVGCTYKYLNGGPGSPAFLYVSQEKQGIMNSPIWGWFGDSRPFEFKIDYSPAETINKFQVGTPPILSLSAIETSVDLMLNAGIEALHDKSIRLIDYFIFLIRERLAGYDFEIASPADPRKRGSHISIKHPEGYRICKALIDRNLAEYSVIPDFRDPDIIRFGIAPLYNGYNDIFRAVEKLYQILSGNLFDGYSNSRDSVT